MENSSKNIKLGIFVILISLIFTFVIYRVSGGGGLFNSAVIVYAEFDNVEGLLEGCNVRYSGVKIGKVSEIHVKSENVMSVKMSLENNVRTYLKSNAKADINTNGLVGNMLVNITPSKGDAPFIVDGDILDRKEKIELKDMMGTLSNTNDMIAQISASLLEITNKMNNGSGTISQLINDGTLAKNLNTTTHNLANTSRNIRVSTDSITQMISRAAEGKGNLGYLFSDNSLKTQVAQISTSMDSLINDRSEPILQNLQISSEAVVNSSKHLESILSDLQTNGGVFDAILNDTTITKDLKSTIDNLNDGTQKFDESMEALQHHWLIRGFFEKKEKEARKKKEKGGNK